MLVLMSATSVSDLIELVRASYRISLLLLGMIGSKDHVKMMLKITLDGEKH